MARSIVLGNGELCVALDAHAQVRDLYFPHVGQEDHVRGNYLHRIGIWVDGTMSWFSEDPLWRIDIQCEEEALASRIVARHPKLAVELVFKDIVYTEQPVFFRRVVVTNHGAGTREIKLYFGQQFEIYKVHGGDTAYFDPAMHTVIHYKGRRVFLINAMQGGKPFSDYAIGIANFHGKEGAYRDADDGMLSKNPIEHGPVDSAVGVYAAYGPGESHTCHYWIAATRSIAEARELNHYILKKTPEHLIGRASAHWGAWVAVHSPDFGGLSKEHIALYKRSLMYVKAHVDQDGGVLASVDSDMLQYGLDTYSYVWPRDGAYAVLALSDAGETTPAKRFLEFCRSALTEDGYLMHKYLPDGSLGSSWHPWIRDGHPQLPIQEDETALVICAMREYYRMSNDLEFLRMFYEPLVEKAAHFMLHYRDTKTKLPEACYDLWEEKRGVFTFTTAAVYAALTAAAELSAVLKKTENEQLFRTAAEETRDALLKYLWNEKAGAFFKMAYKKDGEMAFDATIDASSAWGVFSFGVLPIDDPRLERAWEATVRSLSHGIPAGGIARYEGDQYYRQDRDSAGNPWILTTLWYAEYLTARAKNIGDLGRVREIFDWVVKYAQPSGVLSEQLDPRTGAQISATPLTWSHAAYVSAVIKYLARTAKFSDI